MIAEIVRPGEWETTDFESNKTNLGIVSVLTSGEDARLTFMTATAIFVGVRSLIRVTLTLTIILWNHRSLKGAIQML